MNTALGAFGHPFAAAFGRGIASWCHEEFTASVIPFLAFLLPLDMRIEEVGCA